MVDKAEMPLGVKLKLIALIPVLIFRALKYILTITLSSRPSRPLKRTLAIALGRASALTIAPVTAPYTHIFPSTSEAIKQYALNKKIPHRAVLIPIPQTPSTTPDIPPPTLHLLNPPTDYTTTAPNRTLLFFHGGGYTTPLFGPSLLPFAARLAAAARAPTLALLEYSLAPRVPYPGQLVQALEALRYLLRAKAGSESEVSGREGKVGEGEGEGEGEGRRAAWGRPATRAHDVVLAGDSAGGNLAAGVLAHLASPSAYAAPFAGFGDDASASARTGSGLGTGTRQRLGAAVLVSPWAGMAFAGGSYEANAEVDAIGVRGMEGARDAWRPKAEDVWADMLGGMAQRGSAGGTDAEGFWKGVFHGEGRVVDRALVTVGEEEMLLDDVVSFARLAGAVEKGAGGMEDASDGGLQDDGSVLLVKSPGEAHDGAVADCLAGVTVKGSMLSDILDWLERLSKDPRRL